VSFIQHLLKMNAHRQFISIKVVLLKAVEVTTMSPPVVFYSFVPLRSLPLLSTQNDLGCFPCWLYFIILDKR